VIFEQERAVDVEDLELLSLNPQGEEFLVGKRIRAQISSNACCT